MPEIVTTSTLLWTAAALGYLLGSIPFGLVIARVMGLGNLREIGSGNIGATNVLRTGNKLAALLTVLLDGGKGVAAVLIARAWLSEDAAQIAGLGAFLGHLYPVWLGFRGGKGVATCLGVLLGLSLPVGAAVCATWLFIAVTLRFSSLAALVSVSLTPMWMILFSYTQGIVLAIVLTILIYVRHYPNILRLGSGTEPRIGQKDDGPEDAA